MSHLIRPAALLLALGTCAAFAAEAEKKPAPSATPVSVIVTAPLPAELEAGDRPHQEAGLRFSFMVEGENFVGVKPDGLAVTAATDANGKDISATRDGAPTWKLSTGWDNKVTKDGNYAFFSFNLNPGKKINLVGAVDGVVIDGTITLLTSPGSKKFSQALTLGQPVKEGGLEFTLTKNDNGTSLSVKGPHATISGDVVLTSGGKKLPSRGSGGWNEEYSYSFEKAAGPVTLEVSLWRDIQEATVPFHYGKKK